MERQSTRIHPGLISLTRRFKTGDTLFLQGQMARTLFLILNGQVSVLVERDGEERVEDVVGPGAILGERTVIDSAPRQRSFSAQAITEISALEIGPRDIDYLFTVDVRLATKIMHRIFRTLASRLDEQNCQMRSLLTIRGNKRATAR